MNNTSNENLSENDFDEYLNEYQLQLQKNQNEVEPICHYEDGELEAAWLVSSGFPDLTKPFEEGLEFRTSDLEPILSNLPTNHAEAVKQRVRALNRTVRGRTKSRYKRKPDIRDVFRDYDDCSTGTRSRSATPDSLDSLPGDESWNNQTIPNIVSIFDSTLPQKLENGQKTKLRRTPSAPLKGSQDIFRGSHVRCDIPSVYAEDGIELLGFSRIGTIHIPRIRSGSDPSCSVGRARGNLILGSHSDNNLSSDSSDEYVTKSPVSSPQKITIYTPPPSGQNSPSSREGISFEGIFRETEYIQRNLDTVDGSDYSSFDEYSSDIDSLSENDLKLLQPLFWLELATLFDKHHVNLDKRKPFKRRRKEEGNLFGVSLNALIRRDQQITGEDSSLVPLFVQGVLNEITGRGCKEEGILRVAGHKQKTEILYNELESAFYQKQSRVKQLLEFASVHDLSALLKRWLRELPQPLLSNELIQLFYQTNSIPPTDQYKALSIVCQMLPHENRNTLRTLLKFLNNVIENQSCNKMSKHNVATILAPSFFPPRFIHPINKNSIEEQVKMAAQCCHLTGVLMTRGESLFMVPNFLIEQTKLTKSRQGKRGVTRKMKESSSLQNVNEQNTNNSSSSKKYVQRIII